MHEVFFMGETLIIGSDHFSGGLEIGGGEIYGYSSVGVLGNVNAVNIYSGGKMTVSSGGNAADTNIFSGGKMELSGSAAYTSVFSGGEFSTLSGGSAAGFTEIFSGGSAEIFSGARVDNLGIYSGGSVTLSSGAHADNVALEQGGKIGSYIHGGEEICNLTNVTGEGVAGNAYNVVIRGTELTFLADARAGYTEIHGTAGSAGTAGTLYLYGELTDGVLVGNGGILSAGEGARILNSAVIQNGGSMYISAAGENVASAADVEVQNGGMLTAAGSAMFGDCHIASGASASAGGDVKFNTVSLADGAEMVNSGRIETLDLQGGASYNDITFYQYPGVDSDGSSFKTQLNLLSGSTLTGMAQNLFYTGQLDAAAGAEIRQILLRSASELLNRSGTVISAVISSGGMLDTTGGTVSSVIVESGGIISAWSEASLQKMVISSGGAVYMNDSAGVSAVTVERGGYLHFEKEYGSATDLIMSAGAKTNHYTQGGSSHALIGTMTGDVIQGETSGLNLAFGQLSVKKDLIFDTVIGKDTGITAMDGAVMSATDVFGYLTVSGATVVDAEVFSGGNLTANKEVTFGGVMTVSGRVDLLDKVTIEPEFRFVFDLSCRTSADLSIVSDLDQLKGAAFTIIVDDLMETGNYKLAITNKTFDDTVSVTLEDGLILTEDLRVGGDALAANGLLFTLLQSGKQLYLSVTFDEPQPPTGLVGTPDSLSWHPVANVDTYYVEYYAAGSDDFFRFSAGVEGVNTFGLQTGDYDWRVFSKGAKERFTRGDTITVTNGTTDARLHWVGGDADGKTDVFFAISSGKCGALDIAVNDLTGEKINTVWKNSFDAVFTGSDDHSVIALTHDVRGDAFYLDNSLLDYPQGVADGSPRFSNVEEILAGAGNDLIDLTSQRFSFEKITVRGGDDDDVIWGGNGINILYGDAGNDRISANQWDDVLIGGSGDDVLNGCGGDDIFVFGEYSGRDVILQDGSGSVTLQFEENITKDMLTVSGSGSDTIITWGEINSITVKDRSAAEITLKFVSDDDIKNGTAEGYLG